ncbi:MAG TPA: ABC transporter substrate-binding protein [Sphaerochaeta sp.]|jgi:branched-chain amino acid transport system substrate-binding protein|nr:ABC transporter substrate-binding protein [Sphaerochaeta sp.]HPZ15926.1 ABC transporter substrate-binding protein [Sphaerochaeta sp.]
MKKSLFVLLAVLVVFAFPVVAQGGKEGASPKIGFIGPMTGDNANYGVLSNNSAILAVEQFNAKGGIDGKIPVVLVTEDSEGVPEKGLSSIEKLSSSDKIVGLIGPIFTGVSFAVGERVQNEGIIMLSPSATHADITDIGDYVFRTVVSDGLQGEVAGTYFAKVLGYTNVGVLYAKNDYSQGLYEGMAASFTANGGKITIVESFNVGDKDLKTQLTKIRSANPQAIYIPNYTAEMAQILEQAAQLGMKIPFLSSDGFSDPNIYNLAGDFTDGVIYVGPAKVKESPSYAKFVADYTAKYGVGPDSFATNAFDGTNILLAAMDKVYKATGKFDRKAVRDAVAATKDYQGVTGTVNFAENGDLVAYQGLYKVNKTTPEYLGTFTVVDGELVQID